LGGQQVSGDGSALSKELLNARDLPPKVRNFADASVVLPRGRHRPGLDHVMDLPPSDMLL
jgi:hypothetical protein